MKQLDNYTNDQLEAVAGMYRSNEWQLVQDYLATVYDSKNNLMATEKESVDETKGFLKGLVFAGSLGSWCEQILESRKNPDSLSNELEL